MTFQIPFIGRRAEIDLIDRLIKATATQVLCIGGPGGIGKTSLLRDVYSRYMSNQASSVSITEIIDFDNSSAQDIDGIRQHLIREINTSKFVPYLTELEVLHKMETAEVGFDALECQRNIVENTFRESFNTQYADQRNILLFDTADMIRRFDLERDIVNLMTGLNNSLSIISGRNVIDVWKLIYSKLGDNAIYHEIPPLDEDEELFDCIQDLFQVNLEPHKQKILLLAGGRPIWIFLAIEWITQSDTALKKLDERYKITELISLPTNELKRVQEEFGQQLVQNITSIRSHRHQLLLIMSRIYPINVDMIAEIIDKESAQEIFDEAIAYPYIKSPRQQFISLHDDMREMINKYVWPRLDPSGERRRRDSRWAIDNLTRRTVNLRKKVNMLNNVFLKETGRVDSRLNSDLISQIIDAEQNLWALEFQRLEHAWFVDPQNGKKVFIHLFDEATSTYRMLIRDKLIEQAQSLITHLPLEDRFEIDLRVVQALLYTANFNQAQDILVAQLYRSNLSDMQRASFLILLGRTKIGLGKIRESIKEFSDAHLIASRLSAKEQVASYRWLGQGYLNLGQYETAVKHLERARELSRDLPITIEQGWILNDLAYVYSRLEYLDFEAASLSTANEAEALWRDLKNDRGRGALYVVYMSIYKRRRKYETSLDFGDRAWSIFEPQNDLDWLCRISFERGVAFLESGDYEKAKYHIEKAKDFGINQYLPEIYYWLAQTYISSGDERLAYDCSIEGSKLSRNANPQYYLYLLGQQVHLATRLGYLESLNDFEIDYREYKDTYPEIQQLAAETLLNYFMGILAIHAYRLSYSKDLATNAIMHLTKAMPGIAQHIVYGENQLPNALEKLDGLLENEQSSEWETFKRILGQELNNIWHKVVFYKSGQEVTLDMDYPEALKYFEKWQR